METPASKREEAYDTYEVLPWGGKKITVTKAAQLYGYYLAEGRTDICAELQPIIAEVKKEIREHFPEDN